MKNVEIKKMNEGMKDKYGIDFIQTYNYICGHYGRENVIWHTTEEFLAWADSQGADIPYGSKLRRIDKSEPYGPDNCRFELPVSKRPVAVDCTAFELKEPKTLQGPKRATMRRVKEIATEAGVAFNERYTGAVEKGIIDPDIWPKYDYLNWCIDQYENGSFLPGMYIHKIRKDKPFSPDNAYFSYRQDNGKTKHGLSISNIGQMWYGWSEYYRERLKKDTTINDFVESALRKGYEHHNRLHTDDRDKEEITVEDIYFTDSGVYDDIKKIKEAYSTIPERKNGFGDEKNFIAWSILSGYSSKKEFRKVGMGNYSADTCVWDIFTNPGVNTGRQVTAVKRPKECYKIPRYHHWKSDDKDPECYARYSRWRDSGGLCDEWMDYNTFKDFCVKHNIRKGVYISRIDRTRPFAPDNIRMPEAAA